MKPRPLSQRELAGILDAMFVAGSNWRGDRGLAKTTLDRTLREARRIRRQIFDGLILVATPKAHRKGGRR